MPLSSLCVLTTCPSLPWPGEIGCKEALAPLAGQALPPCPGGEGHVHPHLPDPGQLPQHQAIHSCLRQEQPQPEPTSPTCGEALGGGSAQEQVLPEAPALPGEHQLTRSWDTCTAPAPCAGRALRTGQLRCCRVISLAAL